jgi:two-component system invasion response regulator UvrY
MIKVLIADDHPIVRRGIREVLSEADDITVADEAGDCAEVMHKLRENRFDVVLLDIAMPGRGGIEVLKQIKDLGVDIPVLILSIFPEEQYALRALRAGASGYVTKNCEAELLVKAIRKVAEGGKWVSEAVAERLIEDMGEDAGKPLHGRLSDREYEVMMRLASGKSVSEIAQEMALSVKTVSTYRTRILQKMHMKNNAELIHYALMNKLIE